MTWNIAVKPEHIFNYLLERKAWKGSPVVSREIERRFNLSGPDVRTHIRYLRRIGYAIGIEKGYIICKTREEYLSSIENFTKRIFSMLETRKEMKRALQHPEFVKQLELFRETA